MILNNDDGNALISNCIKENIRINVGRVGFVELSACAWNNYTKGEFSLGDPQIEMAQNNAGVYGSISDVVSFCQHYQDAIANCNIQVSWEMGPDRDRLQDCFFESCKYAHFIRNRSVEPFFFSDPWSKELEGKKVLVIHPYSKSIQKQYENRDLLWKNKNVLPSFDLSTYKSVQSIAKTGPHSGWLESFNLMKKDIMYLDFDIALLGCGGYGMPLAHFISEGLNKSAIYVGGGLQILFGIKGKRWDEHSDISPFYNEHSCCR
jgi:hypothetical protein